MLVASTTGIVAALDAVGFASSVVLLLLHAPRIEADRRILVTVVNNIFFITHLLITIIVITHMTNVSSYSSNLFFIFIATD
ncbi:hypothetical protein D3C76_1757260 [compost metagenome]